MAVVEYGSRVASASNASVGHMSTSTIGIGVVPENRYHLMNSSLRELYDLILDFYLNSDSHMYSFIPFLIALMTDLCDSEERLATYLRTSSSMGVLITLSSDMTW